MRKAGLADLRFARADMTAFIAFHRELTAHAELCRRFPQIAYEPIGDLNGEPARFHLYLLGDHE